MLTVNSSREIGLHPARWQAVLDHIESLCERNVLPSAGLLVGRGDKTTGTHLFGRQRLSDTGRTIREDAIFLVASITKPIVASAALMLVERGELLLDDRVTEFIPDFAQHGKDQIAIRHLLTHTSGLPDMPLGNLQLRAKQASLADFATATCKAKLAFPPGHGVQYQSMGFCILGEIIARVSGKPCREFLREEFFEPLEMNDTSLGVPDGWFEGSETKTGRIAEIRVPHEQHDAADWDWNSRYWRQFGAPWGGLVTTPGDLAKFAAMMLRGGRTDSETILSPAAVRTATRNQLFAIDGAPEKHRDCRPWGLGWRLHWPAHSANFGDLLGPRTYGHWGATGTLLWIDPDAETFAIFLTTLPQEPRGLELGRVSNQVAAALS